MINNEYNKVNGSDINNNSNNDLNVSTRPTSFQKKYRKDAKGNLIMKKKINIKKTKHHINFIDKINTKKELVTVIDIESYKKYNLENDNEIEEEEEDINNKNNDNKQLVEETNIVTSHGCCKIIQFFLNLNLNKPEKMNIFFIIFIFIVTNTINIAKVLYDV